MYADCANHAARIECLKPKYQPTRARHLHNFRLCFAPRLSTCVYLLLTVAALGPAGFDGADKRSQMALDWPIPRRTRSSGGWRGGRFHTFYFGAVNGGIWKTTDAGTVWSPIFDGQPAGSIGALAVAPSDAKTIYAGTGESDIRSALSSATAFINPPTAAQPGRTLASKIRGRSAELSLIRAMRTSCMWALWGTRMLPTISAVFFSRSTEERIGRGFSIWDRRSAFPIWRFALPRRRLCLRARGIRIALRGARMLRSKGRAAGFIARKMRARRGHV